jgi:VCBS repeat-containing protein
MSHSWGWSNWNNWWNWNNWSNWSNNYPPTANDDFIQTDENAVSTFNVLANDTDPNGSNTFSLYTVNNSVIAAGDVLILASGASITWSGDSGIFDYDPGNNFDHLAVGETGADSFVYSIRDNTGYVSANATVHITLEGTNDGPIVTGVSSALISEDVPHFELDLLTGATDVDTSDVLEITDFVQVSGPTAGWTLNGSVLDIDPGTFNSLAEGESAVLNFSFVVSDGNGGTVSRSIAITITGSNDAPGISAALLSNFNEDDAPLSVDLLEAAIDPDNTDTLEVVDFIQESGRPAGWQLNGAALDITLSEFNDLQIGESEALVFSYLVADGNGGIAQQSLTLTVTGSNDGPVAAVDTGSTDENAAITVDVLANDSDVDTTDTLTVTGASLQSGSGSVAVVSNQVSWSPGTDYDYLAVGESAQVVIDYTIEDSQGAPSSATLTLSVTGSNDGPVAAVDTGSTDENAAITVDVLANDSDVDTTDTLTVTGASLQSGSGSVAVVSNQVSWSPGTDYDYLAVGESAQVVIDYTIEDSQGAPSSATLTLSVTGSNDGPVVELNQGRHVINGFSTVIGSQELFSVDVDNAADEIIYEVLDQPDHGILELGGVGLNVGDSFTQDDVNSGRVSYVNDGSNNSEDSVRLKVSDIHGASAGEIIHSIVIDIHADLGNGKDVFSSGAGNDVIQGSNGKDHISTGAGNDRLFGGNGKDILAGGEGNDTLIGGLGNDTFIFGNLSGNDVIEDFTPGKGKKGGDVIDLAEVSSVNNFNELMNAASEGGGNVILDLGGGNSITLVGVQLGQLGSDDFIF